MSHGNSKNCNQNMWKWLHIIVTFYKQSLVWIYNTGLFIIIIYRFYVSAIAALIEVTNQNWPFLVVLLSCVDQMCTHHLVTQIYPTHHSLSFPQYNVCSSVQYTQQKTKQLDFVKTSLFVPASHIQSVK